MYEFYYKYKKRKYNTKLLFTDIDRLVFKNKTDDVYEDFYDDKNLFDFSDYTRDSKLFYLAKIAGNKNICFHKLKYSFQHFRCRMQPFSRTTYNILHL